MVLFQGLHAVFTEAVPAFTGTDEGPAAEGAARGKEVFPQKKHNPPDIHAGYRAPGYTVL
jgi:hypothetical protein